MRRVESYETLSRTASGYLRPGVTANVMITREKLEESIATGRLFMEADESNLWLAMRRESHVRLYFYLNDLRRPLDESFDLPAVAEIAFRGETASLAALQDCLAQSGLEPAFQRVRLMRRPERLPAENSVFVQQPSVESARDFLEKNFSPLTGCLPTFSEISAGIADRQFLSLEDGKGVAGLIHTAPEKNGIEIRHLAVREDRRGQGLAGSLVTACLLENPEKIFRVWVREDYHSARQVYAKAGFGPDGWRSQVYQGQLQRENIKEKEE